jgi:hypothetical protein
MAVDKSMMDIFSNFCTNYSGKEPEVFDLTDEFIHNLRDYCAYTTYYVNSLNDVCQFVSFDANVEDAINRMRYIKEETVKTGANLTNRGYIIKDKGYAVIYIHASDLPDEVDYLYKFVTAKHLKELMAHEEEFKAKEKGSSDSKNLLLILKELRTTNDLLRRILANQPGIHT